MFYKKANEKIEEVEDENLPEGLVVKYVYRYCICAEVCATIMAIALVILYGFTALLAGRFYLIGFFQAVLYFTFFF